MARFFSKIIFLLVFLSQNFLFINEKNEISSTNFSLCFEKFYADVDSKIISAEKKNTRAENSKKSNPKDQSNLDEEAAEFRGKFLQVANDKTSNGQFGGSGSFNASSQQNLNALENSSSSETENQVSNVQESHVTSVETEGTSSSTSWLKNLGIGLAVAAGAVAVGTAGYFGVKSLVNYFSSNNEQEQNEDNNIPSNQEIEEKKEENSTEQNLEKPILADSYYEILNKQSEAEFINLTIGDLGGNFQGIQAGMLLDGKEYLVSSDNDLVNKYKDTLSKFVSSAPLTTTGLQMVISGIGGKNEDGKEHSEVVLTSVSSELSQMHDIESLLKTESINSEEKESLYKEYQSIGASVKEKIYEYVTKNDNRNPSSANVTPKYDCYISVREVEAMAAGYISVNKVYFPAYNISSTTSEVKKLSQEDTIDALKNFTSENLTSEEKKNIESCLEIISALGSSEVLTESQKEKIEELMRGDNIKTLEEKIGINLSDYIGNAKYISEMQVTQNSVVGQGNESLESSVTTHDGEKFVENSSSEEKPAANENQVQNEAQSETQSGANKSAISYISNTSISNQSAESSNAISNSNVQATNTAKSSEVKIDPIPTNDNGLSSEEQKAVEEKVQQAMNNENPEYVKSLLIDSFSKGEILDREKLALAEKHSSSINSNRYLKSYIQKQKRAAGVVDEYKKVISENKLPSKELLKKFRTSSEAVLRIKTEDPAAYSKLVSQEKAMLVKEYIKKGNMSRGDLITLRDREDFRSILESDHELTLMLKDKIDVYQKLDTLQEQSKTTVIGLEDFNEISKSEELKKIIMTDPSYVNLGNSYEKTGAMVALSTRVSENIQKGKEISAQDLHAIFSSQECTGILKNIDNEIYEAAQGKYFELVNEFVNNPSYHESFEDHMVSIQLENYDSMNRNAVVSVDSINTPSNAENKSNIQSQVNSEEVNNVESNVNYVDENLKELKKFESNGTNNEETSNEKSGRSLNDRLEKLEWHYENHEGHGYFSSHHAEYHRVKQNQ